MSLSEAAYVSGWVPSYGDDDDVDISNFAYPIKVPDDFHSSSPTLSRTSSIDSHSLPLHLSSSSCDQPPPSPSSSADHTDGSHTDVFSPPLSSSDRRAIRNRLRDPDWVPRPRNAFIIFRCEFSRKHARDPSDSSDKSSRSDKTLSKRAGEEWRHLSAAEREQYKTMAEQEKAAHALQNPDYRFKPVRRPPHGTASSAVCGRPSTCRRTDRSAQVASLIMRSERGATSSFARDEVYEDNAYQEPPPDIQPSSSSAVTRRRRAASMPQPVAAQKAVIPSKARTPVPISCVSSPGPTPLDFEMFSSSEVDSPLYTPVQPTSPALHGLSSGFQMQALPEHPSPLNGAFECGMDVGGTQVRFLLCALYSVLRTYAELLRAYRCHLRTLRVYRHECQPTSAIHVCRRRCIPHFAGADDPIHRLGVRRCIHRVVLGFCRRDCAAPHVARYRRGPILLWTTAPSYTPNSPASYAVGTSRNPHHPLGHGLRGSGEWSRYVRRCSSRP